MNNEDVYYQPNLSDKEWNENRWFNTFDVYHNFANAKGAFPNAEIGAYSGDDIENRKYLDDTPSDCTTIEIEMERAVEVIANNLSIMIKHNDVGVSIDYYPNPNGEGEPFRADQVWFEDIEE